MLLTFLFLASLVELTSNEKESFIASKRKIMMLDTNVRKCSNLFTEEFLHRYLFLRPFLAYTRPIIVYSTEVDYSIEGDVRSSASAFKNGTKVPLYGNLIFPYLYVYFIFIVVGFFVCICISRYRFIVTL